MVIQNGRTLGSTEGVDPMKIVSNDDLDLVDFAADAARILLKAHPEVLFTSGRRTVDEQALAMAANVIKRRKWIEQTYVKTAERDALQRWIDGHPEARTQAAISAGLESIMSGWSDDQKPVSRCTFAAMPSTSSRLLTVMRSRKPFNRYQICASFWNRKAD